MNCSETTRYLELQYGPFDRWEIEFYKERLKNERGVIINSFQKQLIFNLFYKVYGDTQSIYGINSDDYVKLMLAAKKILIDNNMIILPYIISGKVDKLVGRKTVNKKERARLEATHNFEQIIRQYRNDKIIQNIMSMIATIISSDFSFIDYRNKELDGKKIDALPDIIFEEISTYVLLI